MKRFILLCLVACGHPQHRDDTPEASNAIAFVDVTVVPMDKDGALEHQTVVVRHGEVTEVGAVTNVLVPPGAQVIQGAGKWLIPGLADMHVHTYDPLQLALFATRGVTTVRIMWGDPAAIGIRDAIRAGEQRFAPSIWTAGSIVDGVPPIWPGSTGVATIKAAAAEVDAQRRAGYDFIKVYSKLSPEAYTAIVANAKVPVIGHVPVAVGLVGVLEAKQASIEHLDGYASYAERDDSPLKGATDFKARSALYKYADAAKLADAVARTKAAGTWNCPTLVVSDSIAHLDKPQTDRPELAYVPKSMIVQWDPKQDFRFASWTAQNFEDARGAMAWKLALVKQLSDAGAGLLAGTDVGNPWLVPGYSLHDELALFVAAKLTPQQALRAATAAAAEFLHDAKGGAIAAGKRADLVLLDGDPLADIKNTQKIAGVMLRGRWLPASELAAERDRIAGLYRGEGSRFTTDATPTTAGFRARYAGVGFLSGEERITFVNDHILAEQRLDGAPATLWDLELGKTGRGSRIHIQGDGLNVILERTGKAARLSGKAGHATVDVAEKIDDDEILGGTDAPAGIDAAFQRQLMTLPQGDTATVKLLVLDQRPALALRHMSLQVKRLPDGTRTVGKRSIPVRVFGMAAFGGTQEFALDGDGWLVASSVYQRVD
jgi:amidohydrolase family protein